MSIIAETPRLIIRLFKPLEEQIYLDLFEDERVTRYLPYRSREELRMVFFEYLNPAPKGSITGRWGIFTKAGNDFVGLCLLRPFDDGSGNIELGYVFRYDYWGKGIASEMSEALLNRSYKINPGAKFVAVTDHDNIPSQRVLEKIGMKRDGNYMRNGIDLAFFKMDS